MTERQRRRFVLAAAALLASPAALYAQQRRRPALPLVGALFESRIPNGLMTAFRESLVELGYAEGQDLTVDYRGAGDVPEQLAPLAAQLVRRSPKVILAGGTAAALALMKATPSIPIVFAGVGDAVGEGVVKDPARPEGHVTGWSAFEPRINPKRFELLKEAVPGMRRVAILVDADYSPERLRALQSAASAQKLIPQMLVVRNSEDLRPVLAVARHARSHALLVAPSPLLTALRQPLVDVTRTERWITVFPERAFAEAGGLLSLGADAPDMYRNAARYVLSILQGARVAALPVEAAKLELIVNLRTARQAEIRLPRSLVSRADHRF